MVVSALLVALSFVGADIKIMNTIAFDSMPGFFAALFIADMTRSLSSFIYDTSFPISEYLYLQRQLERISVHLIQLLFNLITRDIIIEIHSLVYHSVRCQFYYSVTNGLDNLMVMRIH